MSIFSGTGSGSASDVNVVTAPTTVTTPLSNLDTEVGAVNSAPAASDSANDSNVIGFLKRLASKLPSALLGDRLKVDGSGVTQPVSVSNFPATQPISAATLPIQDAVVAQSSWFSYSGSGSHGAFDCGPDADYLYIQFYGGGGGFTHNLALSTTSAFSSFDSTAAQLLVYQERMPTVNSDTTALNFSNGRLQSGSVGVYVASLHRTSDTKNRWARMDVTGAGGGNWNVRFTAVRAPNRGQAGLFSNFPGHRVLTHSIVDINSSLRDLPVAVSGTAQVSDRGNTGTVLSAFSSLSSAQLAPASGNRKLLTIYNEGAGNLHVLYGSGTASTTNYSVRLAANDYIEINRYVGQVNAIFAATGTARITEIT